MRPKRSLLGYRWQYPNDSDDATATDAQIESGEPLLLGILQRRGISSAERQQDFLNPPLEQLHALDKIPNLKEAAQLILQEAEAGRKLTIYGDYDVDGTTGSALLITALQELGINKVSHYTPHRFLEGYGLGKTAITKLKEQGTELIITVDCGISNYEEVKLANSLGIKTIITDHHLPPILLPPAAFVVNPKLNNSDFASRHLAGVGVAFALAEQLFRLRGFAPYSKSQKYLDLVALGTVADVAPLVDENRVLVYHGLERMRKKPRAGIKALIEVSETDGTKLTARDIGFKLAPRINAAGRTASATVALELLIEKEQSKAKHKAEHLNELNIQRQNLGLDIQNSAIAEIEQLPNLDKVPAVVLASDQWHAGIIGIVASHLVRLYNRPTALIAVKEGRGRGSIRAPEGINIFEPLTKCGYLLRDFGGHKGAAGFEIDEANIEKFRKKIQRDHS